MPVRILWMILGLTSVVLAVLGSFLPLLPTVPFLLLAAFAFARSSPKLEAWLLGHPQFGPMIRDWQDHGSINRRTKKISVAVMAATFGLSLVLGASTMVLIIQAVVLSCAATFVITRPDGPNSP